MLSTSSILPAAVLALQCNRQAALFSLTLTDFISVKRSVFSEILNISPTIPNTSALEFFIPAILFQPGWFHLISGERIAASNSLSPCCTAVKNAVAVFFVSLSMMLMINFYNPKFRKSRAS
ncbi:hypothetical protein D3C86_1595460 [compost metagenome]